MLTPKEYGIQYSRSYLLQQSQKSKCFVNVYGSEDSEYPKGVYYSYKQYGEERRPYMLKFKSIMSSADEFANVIQDLYQKRNQQNNNPQQMQYSYEQVMQTLGMEHQEKEQLEGNFELQMGGLHYFFAYSNETMKNIPQGN